MFTLGVQPARAVIEDCITKELAGVLGGEKDGWIGHGHRIDLSQYASSRHLLFISDGAGREHFSLADQVAGAYPDKTIYRTDIGFGGRFNPGQPLTHRPGMGPVPVRMDNTKKFPFADDSFDTIVMRQGLCACALKFGRNDLCGGFCLDKPDVIKSFFVEVIRILDKRDPHAFALLHGDTGVTQGLVQTWRKMAAELEAEYPVDIRILTGGKSETGFNSIEIRPRAAHAQPR